MQPDTQYARSGDLHIAYQIVGEGDPDLLFCHGWLSNLELMWEEPSFARFLQRLSSFSRLILFDKRGTGLSDRVTVNELPSLEQRMDDLRVVLDAAHSRRAALFGFSEGGVLASLSAKAPPRLTGVRRTTAVRQPPAKLRVTAALRRKSDATLSAAEQSGWLGLHVLGSGGVGVAGKEDVQFVGETCSGADAVRE